MRHASVHELATMDDDGLDELTLHQVLDGTAGKRATALHANVCVKTSINMTLVTK